MSPGIPEHPGTPRGISRVSEGMKARIETPVWGRGSTRWEIYIPGRLEGSCADQGAGLGHCARKPCVPASPTCLCLCFHNPFYSLSVRTFADFRGWGRFPIISYSSFISTLGPNWKPCLSQPVTPPPPPPPTSTHTPCCCFSFPQA